LYQLYFKPNIVIRVVNNPDQDYFFISFTFKTNIFFFLLILNLFPHFLHIVCLIKGPERLAGLTLASKYQSWSLILFFFPFCHLSS